MKSSNRPQPGLLRYRITITRPVGEQGASGYAQEENATVASVYAGVEDGVSRWFYADGAANTDGAKRFVIRARTDVKEGMNVLYSGDTYVITKIGAHEQDGRYMRLITVRAKGVR